MAAEDVVAREEAVPHRDSPAENTDHPQIRQRSVFSARRVRRVTAERAELEAVCHTGAGESGQADERMGGDGRADCEV